MNIGFDLDKVLIHFPPIIPPDMIRKLYGEKANGHLTYRMPGKIEQWIRQLSHIPLLRQPISGNIELLREMKKNKKWNFFLISSRYGFLKRATEDVVQRYHFDKLFKELYFNYKNEQPHLFKNAALANEKIQAYIDDDLPLLLYLAKKHPKIHFFWLNEKKNGRVQSNIEAVTALKDFFAKL